jgi:hypothetical protein
MSNNSKKDQSPLLSLDDLDDDKTKSFVPKSKIEETPDAATQETASASEVRRYREDGKRLKNIPIQLQGLSSQMLPPITKRKVARYEVIGTNQVDPLTGEYIIAPPCIIPGTFTIYDPFDQDVLKRHKLLKNVTRTELVLRDGKQVVEEYVEDITLENGWKDVAIEKNYLQYVLLELHPLNASNKWRSSSGQAAAFRRVDIDRRAWAETQAGMDLAFEAESVVVALRKPDEIIEYAHAAGIPTAGRNLDGQDSVKYDLRKFARKHPRDFFKLNKSNESAIKIAVIDAIQIGLIDYEVDKRAWFFSTDGERIGSHLPGEEPTEALIKLFKKEDYRKHYEVLQSQLNYWD